jgi:ribosome maturation factor RimP
MKELKEDQLLTIVKNVVEQHGCRLVDIDFDKHIVNIEGPDDAQAQCAVALEQVLGR